MKRLLILAAILMASQNVFASIERINGLGKDRENLTQQQIEQRTEALKQASEFLLLRHPGAKQAPERLFDDKVWKIFVDSARMYGLDPLWLPSIAFVESYGDADAKSPTGPAGIMQFTARSARDEGLVIRTTRRKAGTHQEPVYAFRGKGKNRKRVILRYRTVTDYETTRIDERLDPAKAIPAAAKRLARSLKTFRSLDLALQEYHDGIGSALRLVGSYTGRVLFNGKRLQAAKVEEASRLIEQQQLTYAKIFFDNTPYHHASVYNRLQSLPDFGDTYSFRVLMAYDLLKGYQASSAEYRRRLELYVNRFRDGIAPNRMWTFYSPEDVARLQFEDLAAIQKAKGKRLVNLPTPYESYGFYVRLHGKSSIGEADQVHQQDYIAADPATVGCLLYVLNELKILQGKKFQPYELNSLVRTSDTQEALKATNKNAATELPTHTLGKAFDFPRKNMTGRMRTDVVFVLSDMQDYGMLAFIYEDAQKTIHAVPHPAYEQFFLTIYREATGDRRFPAIQKAQSN